MNPANNPNIDYKALVRDSYNKCAHKYSSARQEYANPELSLLIEKLPQNAYILDIGCGGGVPVAKILAEHGKVFGIDISQNMVALAQKNIPSGIFTCLDIMQAEYPESYFDAITSFYTIFHLPKEEHRELFQKIHSWLKPKGYLMATVAYDEEEPYTEDDFFGVTMYWSNFSVAKYKNMLKKIGFRILEGTNLGHGFKNGVKDKEEIHPLIFAQKV